MSLLSKNYHIITYGCQMNEHDSENIAGMLEALDYSHTPNPEEADVVVMNTCSVREHADKRFFGMLGQFKKQKKNNPDFIICVCGCMPQQPHIVEEIRKSFSWVDIVFGTQTIAEFPNLLMERIRTGKKQFSIIANNEEIPEEKTEKVTAEVNINLDSEYFKWKEREDSREDGKNGIKSGKKSLFGKIIK